MLFGGPGWGLRRLSRWVLGIVLPVVSSASGADTGSGAVEAARQKLGGVRVPFVANTGQTDPAVAYYATTFAGTVFVTREGRIVHSLPGRNATASVGSSSARSAGWSLTETLVGGNARPGGRERASTRVSYIVGNDPSRWRSGLETFESVSLGEVWPGISLDLRAHGKNVEKIFAVEPGADPSRIRVCVEGGRLRVNTDGALVVETGLGDVMFTPPLAFQQRGDVRRPVRVAYELRGKEYGFRLGEYDRSLPVTIDPLVQATYMGGSDLDWIGALAIHPISGDVYVAGETKSTDFPGTAGGAQAGSGGGLDEAFVARLNGALTTLTQATYLGGGNEDVAETLAIHPISGDVYVAGYTKSTNFPGTAGGAQAVLVGGPNAFVARLNAALTALTQATYLGVGDVVADALAIHPTSGDVYVAGYTISTNFPGTAGGAQPANGGGQDGFVARLNASLTTLTQATYLGGGSPDVASALAIHPASGDVYVAGSTNSTNFPGTAGGAQAALGGAQDAFVARLNASLTALTQATYLGGGGNEDVADALAIHPILGDVYVAGHTISTNFPGTAGGAQAANGGGEDAFVARLNTALTTLTQATYLGGSSVDVPRSMAIHPTSGDVYVAGVTFSTDFPGTAGGAQAGSGGGQDDAFVARLNSALTTLNQATYLGGNSYDGADALAIHPASGDVYLAGTTGSTNFPGTPGGAQPARSGSQDGFVARLTVGLVGVEPTPTNTPTRTPTSTPTLAVNIPTTSEGGLLAFGLLLAILGYLLLRGLSSGGSS